MKPKKERNKRNPMAAAGERRMSEKPDALKEKTRKIAELYFKGVPGERPYDLWKSFDKELAKET